FRRVRQTEKRQRSGPWRRALAPCGLRHNSIEHPERERGLRFCRRIEGARQKTKERVWQVWEGPQKGITQHSTWAADPTPVHLSASCYIRRRCAPLPAFLQVSSNNRVNCSDDLLPMLNNPAAQIPNCKSINASILGTL